MLPSAAHLDQPWRIHEITSDFRLEDVWELPWRGGRDDFPDVVRAFASFDPSQTSAPVRLLFAVRMKLGALLGWDRTAAGVGKRVASLRDRLPADLRDGPRGPDGALPYTPLYLTDDEWAIELANQTVHGVLHLARTPDGTATLAIYVKPNGLLGAAYMAFIKPFRHLIVYPSMLRGLSRVWQTTAS